MIAQERERQGCNSRHRDDLAAGLFGLNRAREQRRGAERCDIDLSGSKCRVQFAAAREVRKLNRQVEMRRLGLFLDKLQIFADVKRQKREAVAEPDPELVLRQGGGSRG